MVEPYLHPATLRVTWGRAVFYLRLSTKPNPAKYLYRPDSLQSLCLPASTLLNIKLSSTWNTGSRIIKSLHRKTSALLPQNYSLFFSTAPAMRRVEEVGRSWRRRRQCAGADRRCSPGGPATWTTRGLRQKIGRSVGGMTPSHANLPLKPSISVQEKLGRHQEVHLWLTTVYAFSRRNEGQPARILFAEFTTWLHLQ